MRSREARVTAPAACNRCVAIRLSTKFFQSANGLSLIVRIERDWLSSPRHAVTRFTRYEPTWMTAVKLLEADHMYVSRVILN